MNDDGRGPPLAPRWDRASKRRRGDSRARAPCAPPPRPRSVPRTPPSVPRGGPRAPPASRALLAHFGAGDDGPHLEDRDDGHEADEQEEQREEEAEGPDEGGPVPERRVIHAPRRGEEVPMEARHDDH